MATTTDTAYDNLYISRTLPHHTTEDVALTQMQLLELCRSTEERADVWEVLAKVAHGEDTKDFAGGHYLVANIDKRVFYRVWSSYSLYLVVAEGATDSISTRVCYTIRPRFHSTPETCTLSALLSYCDSEEDRQCIIDHTVRVGDRTDPLDDVFASLQSTEDGESVDYMYTIRLE